MHGFFLDVLYELTLADGFMILYCLKKIAIVLFRTKTHTPKHWEVNFTSNWYTMVSGELDHTYHLECCLGAADKDLPHHLQMLHIY
jgi:hypothetical protein